MCYSKTKSTPKVEFLINYCQNPLFNCRLYILEPHLTCKSPPLLIFSILTSGKSFTESLGPSEDTFKIKNQIHLV